MTEPKVTIVIRRTVTYTERIPFNPDYYPTENTVEEAMEFEKNRELGDILQSFVENLQFAEEGTVVFNQVVRVEREDLDLHKKTCQVPFCPVCFPK